MGTTLTERGWTRQASSSEAEYVNDRMFGPGAEHVAIPESLGPEIGDLLRMLQEAIPELEAIHKDKPQAPAKVRAAKRRSRMFDALRKLPAQEAAMLTEAKKTAQEEAAVTAAFEAAYPETSAWSKKLADGPDVMAETAEALRSFLSASRGVPGGKELSLEGQVFPWMRDAWEKGQLAEEEREGAGEEAGEGAKEEEEEEALRPEVGGGGATGGWAVSGPGGVEWRDEVDYGCCPGVRAVPRLSAQANATRELWNAVLANNIQRLTFLLANSSSESGVRDPDSLAVSGVRCARADRGGQTVLHLACSEGRGEATEALLAAGALHSAPDFEGSTPLLAASLRGDAASVRALLRCGAALHDRNCRGYTALHLAAVSNFTDVVDALLNGGASPSARLPHTRIPAAVAAASKGVGKASEGEGGGRLMLGMTPLAVAEDKGMRESAELLRHHLGWPLSTDKVGVSHVLIKHSGSRRASSKRDPTGATIKARSPHDARVLARSLCRSLPPPTTTPGDRAEPHDPPTTRAERADPHGAVDGARRGRALVVEEGGGAALVARFGALAVEHSDCNSAAKGGALGVLGKGAMEPAFEEAAFSLRVGQVSGIVETRSGVHIILRTL
ncbi:ankyrin repeat-containing domain protein [Baffinella frigidus]|nr:ankyrin repeat-containing domain protein [Cryptophyta sp. CCMP2293]